MVLTRGERQLRIPVRVELPDGGSTNCKALIDTGAEVCLVRTGLVPPDALKVAERPLRLITANQQALGAGKLKAELHLVLDGEESDTGRQVVVRAPTTCFEADIGEDMILSYAWCQGRGIDISARHHGLVCIKASMEIWVDGIRKQTRGDVTVILTIQTEESKRALELFSGTGNTGKVLEAWGFTVTSLDSDPRAGATICEDVMAWDYSRFPRVYFEVVVASLPCTEYSQAKTRSERQL